MKTRLAALAALSLIYFLPRSFFFSLPLVGEEGIFADLIVNHALGGVNGLVGHIHGQDYRVLLIHPSALYQSLCALGALLESPWRALLGEAWHPTWVLRLSLSFYQFIVWACLALWLAPGLRARPWTWLTCAAMLSAPLALGGSLYLQTDPSNGALLAGLMGLALAWMAVHGEAPSTSILLALASFLLGVGGKQEWALGIGAGFCGACLLGKLNSTLEKHEIRLLMTALSCMAVGSLLSWLNQPEAYEGGLKLMVGLGKSHSVLSATAVHHDLIKAMKERIHFLGPLGPLWLGSAWLLWRGNSALRWSLASSLAVALPFMATAWGKDYRYFIPAFMLLCPPLLAELALGRPGGEARIRAFALALSALMALHAAWFIQDAWRKHYSVTERQFLKYDEYLPLVTAREDAARLGHCVAALPSALYWDRKDLDWVGDSSGFDEIEQIAGRFGAHACKP